MCTSVDWGDDACLVACDQAGFCHLLQSAEVRVMLLAGLFAVIDSHRFAHHRLS
jgi:hypothetical protein